MKLKNVLFSISFLIIANIAEAQVIKSIGIFGNFVGAPDKKTNHFYNEKSIGIKFNLKLSKKIYLAILPNMHIQEEFKMPVLCIGSQFDFLITDTIYIFENIGLGLNVLTNYIISNEENLKIFANVGFSFLGNYENKKTFKYNNKYLRTESNWNKQKLFDYKILIGFGVKYIISKKINLELEPTFFTKMPDDQNFGSSGKQGMGMIVGVGLNYSL